MHPALCVLLLLCYWIVGMLPLQALATPVPSVERLVTLPKLDGTAPTQPTWSPDSQSLAFLWNDHGMPYRDVWLVSEGGAPIRLTQGAPAPEQVLGTGEDLSLEALRQRARLRQHGGVSGLVWHPDGSGIYYVLDGELRFVPVDGGQSRVVGPGGGSLSISPDGKRLALIRGGDLWVKDLSSGTFEPLTELGVTGIGTVAIGAYVRPDAYVGRYRWSPDGQRLAFEFVDQRAVRRVPFPSYLHDEPLLHEVRRPYPGDTDLLRRVGVVDLDGSLDWLALESPDRRLVLELEWSPGGERLLIMQGADVAEQRWILVARPDDGTVETVWEDQRSRRIYPIFRALWSADGQAIYFIGDHEDYYRLYALPAEGGAAQRLSGDYDIAGDWSAAWITLDPTSGDVLLVSAEHSPHERHVHRLPSTGGPSQRLTTLPGVHQPTLSPDGRRLAVLRSSDTAPTELYWLELDGKSTEQRLTHSPLPEFEALDWLEPEYVSFPSRIDDYRIHARIIRPPEMQPGKRYPVMFGSIYSNTALNQWNPDRPTSFLQQQMALRGDYITVLVDVRGSVGYGVDFREAFQGDWGGADLEDLHSAVTYLASLDEVDPDRIGIWGNSYGGLLVLSALMTKPGLFAAGVAGAPAVDIWHFTGFDQHLTRRPDTHPEIFAHGSLLDLGEKLEDPLLIIHGVHDDIVPLKTTLMMAEKLKLLGKRFELDIVHDSGHWWAASEHYARYTFRRLEEFMHRHVPPGPR
ncbi:MAG: S9 family peptidase [Wenzhouxiangella sp.]|nr:MAG: S9 family peptidase [Wenzhouxiangella sp.]